MALSDQRTDLVTAGPVNTDWHLICVSAIPAVYRLQCKPVLHSAEHNFLPLLIRHNVGEYFSQILDKCLHELSPV